MNLIKPRYGSLLFLYLPFLMVAIAIMYCWPQQIVLALKFIFPLFLLCLLLLTITPAGSHLVKKTQNTHKKLKLIPWLALWLIMELGLSICYLAIKQTIMGPDLLIDVKNHSSLTLLQSGLYPWSLYLLLGIAFAYFSSDQENHPFIRNPLQAIYKSNLGGNYGIGIDLAMKQGIMFLCCFTIGILIIQISNLLSFFLHLPPSTFNYPTAIFTSAITFLLLASSFWQRFTRYLEKKQYSFGTILALITLFIISFSLLFNTGVKLLSSHSQALNPSLNSHPSSNIWPFFSLIWWTAWAPVIAIFIARLARDYTIRATILAGLLFPALFVGLTAYTVHYPTFSHLIASYISILGNKSSELVLALIAFMGTIVFFKSTDGLGIEPPNQTARPTISVSLIRVTARLIASAMFAYLMTGLSSLTLLAAGVIWFVFFNSSTACLSLIIFAPYRSFREK